MSDGEDRDARLALRRPEQPRDVERLVPDDLLEAVPRREVELSAVERDGVLNVSSLYERNEVYFPDFDKDLKAHLMQFIEGPERAHLSAATRMKPNIDDWTVTDLYGTHNQIGGSFADNRAALVDSVQNVQVGDELGQLSSGNFSAASSMVMTKGARLSRFNPELTIKLQGIKEKEEAAFLEKGGTVTVEELYAPYDPDAESAEEEEDEDEGEGENN